MQVVKQEYVFSTVVSDSSQENEFIVEFTPLMTNAETENVPVKITRNFDELLDFLDEFDVE